MKNSLPSGKVARNKSAKDKRVIEFNKVYNSQHSVFNACIGARPYSAGVNLITIIHSYRLSWNDDGLSLASDKRFHIDEHRHYPSDGISIFNRTKEALNDYEQMYMLSFSSVGQRTALRHQRRVLHEICLRKIFIPKVELN